MEERIAELEARIERLEKIIAQSNILYDKCKFCGKILNKKNRWCKMCNKAICSNCDDMYLFNNSGYCSRGCAGLDV